MKKRNLHKARTRQPRHSQLARRTGELANAVPQVVAMRLGRMLGAGPLPSAGDQQEMLRMGAEKLAAFGEAWTGMAWQALAAQQQLAQWWFQTWWQTGLSGWTNPPTAGHLWLTAQQKLYEAALDTALRGVAPVHRRAVANARRLRAQAI